MTRLIASHERLPGEGCGPPWIRRQSSLSGTPVQEPRCISLLGVFGDEHVLALAHGLPRAASIVPSTHSTHGVSPGSGHLDGPSEGAPRSKLCFLVLLESSSWNLRPNPPSNWHSPAWRKRRSPAPRIREIRMAALHHRYRCSRAMTFPSLSVRVALRPWVRIAVPSTDEDKKNRWQGRRHGVNFQE